jgi:nucleotide-binding universal stress UspA family protein
MGQKAKRILLTVDGSEQSMDAVRYVCNAVQHSNAEIVVYQVMSKVPEVFWDLKNDPVWEQKIESLRIWEQQQETIATGFINTTLALFKGAGFDEKRITTKIGRQKEGIARDIIAEAKLGYDVVVVGRGKTGSEEGMPLGSVASKVLGAATTFSLWLIGGTPSSDKLLVAMDSSEGGMRAVDHAGTLLNNGKNPITLFHAIRGITVSAEGMEDIFPESYRKQLMNDAEKEIQPAFDTAKAHLAKLDVAPNRVTTQIVTSVRSRAAAIVQEAKKNEYGTIIVGRRGITEVAEFAMGRVTNKLTQMARHQALCIVV